jgi:hypothetical protein
LIACEVLSDWLEHSERYVWVRVEADEAKFLDDVVAMLAGGRLVVKQVKFSTNPEGEDDPLTWEKLLATPPGKSARARMSLLEKWATSLRELLADGPLAEASVVSNRVAGDDLRAALNSATGLVDFDRIADDVVRAEVVRQLEGESEARQFFGQFQFRLNEPSLNDLESSLRRRFDRLGGSETGWLNLKSEVRFWVAHRYEPPPDGAIKLSDVTRAARWHALQSLSQRFNVPRDYVVPSEEFHRDLESSLLSTGGGCYVITASPGVGKSTYTSYLYDQLKKQDTPVIRHHYYLSQDDQTGVARLAHIRAAESLMYDLKGDYAEALGAHAGENPVARSLREWLIACGGFYARQGKMLVVIIDGLDHVWRDTRSVEELTKLLQLVLPAPEGVVVLLATQPVDDSQLPPILLKYAPRDTWLRLPPLDQQAVAAWLRHHESELVLPAAKVMAPSERHVPDYQFQRISEALYEKSRGHPLHLRYTLKALQERDQLVTVENIERLPGCTHDDIRDYYRDLWRVLPEDSRAILHLLAANRFPWTKRGIFECLNPDGTGYPALNNSLRQVEHLLSDDGTGLRPFHASLLAFVEDLQEHADYRTAMRRNALNWLRRDAPEYLRWAYVWTLEADLGDDRALREGPSREWLIESIARRYPRGQMLNILSRSIWCSLRQEDLPRAVEVGLLHDYCFRAFQNDPEVYEKLLFAQLKVADGERLRPRLRARLSRLSETDATILARHEAENGNVSFANECLDELAGRMRAEQEQTHVEWKAQARAIVEVAALLDDVDPARVVDFAVRNRDDGDTADLLNTFAFTLRVMRNGPRLKRTLALIPSSDGDFDVDMTADERGYVLRHAVWLALEEGFELDDVARRPENSGDPYCLIYAAIRKPEDFQPSPARMPDARLFESRTVSPMGPPMAQKDLLYSCLSGFLANHLWDMGRSNPEWIATVGRTTRAGRCLQWLDEAAGKVAESLRAGQPPPFSLLYRELKSFDDPSKSEAYNTEAMGLRNSIVRAVKHFALDLLSAAVAMDDKVEVSKDDLEIAFASGYCYWDDWMNEYVSRRRVWLSEEAVSWLLESQAERLATTIEQFPERASTYSTLASLAALHRCEEETRQFIRDAGANLVTHGNHKDVLFFHVLHAIVACYNAGIPEARGWLLRIATPIAHVEEFTDGDETGHLPRELAEVLLEIAHDLFPSYYAWLCDREEAYDALHAFHSFIEAADFSSPVNRAVAATAIDGGSLKVLSGRAREDDGARSALDFVQELLGEKGIEKSLHEEERSTNDSFERKPSPVSPSEYQPEDFEGFLAALEAGEHIWKNDAVQEWINHWLAEKRDESVFNALEQAVARGVELRDYDQTFELALKLHGRERAYPWLVKAHREQRGWNRYWASKEKAQRRWQQVERLYPQRWFDFIRETLRKEDGAAPWQDLYLDSGIASQLVEFCVMMNKIEVARNATERLVEGSLRLVELLPLPEPEWINEG